MNPTTIIVVHRAEKRSKCSVEPLRKTGEFIFWRYPKRGVEPVEGYVRLGLGGPQLSIEDGERGLLLLDGSWRWAARASSRGRQSGERCRRHRCHARRTR